MNRKALLPGTFDPPTLGHLDIIQRAACLCDFLFVGIASNTEKVHNLFSVDERKVLLQDLTKEISNVEIVICDGLVVEFAKKNEVQFLIRGLRTYSDFEKEYQMALANRKLLGIETLFLMAGQDSFHISASLIREIGRMGHRLNGFVPDMIEDSVFHRLSGFL